MEAVVSLLPRVYCALPAENYFLKEVSCHSLKHTKLQSVTVNDYIKHLIEIIDIHSHLFYCTNQKKVLLNSKH